MKSKKPQPLRVETILYRVSLILVLILSVGVAPGSEAKSPAPNAAAPGPLILDDAPAPLVPRQPRTEADRDRIEALSLFAAGRMHEGREEYADALRCYQRSLRCDPQASVVARAIIPVAVRLKRSAEAVRYALKAAKLNEADPLLLRRLGIYLTDEGDWSGALELYEKALAGRDQTKETAADIILRMEMGRLYQLAEKYKPAAENFVKVVYALDHPAEFAIDDQLKKMLLGEPGPTYNLIGECFLLADRPGDALIAFKKAEELAPNKGLLQFNLARVYAKTAKPAEALAALETCFAEHLGGEGMAPYETLADALKQLGKSDELIPRLEKLRAGDAGNVPLGYFLAAQYRTAGKLDKAESLYVDLLKNRATLTGYRSLTDIYRQAKRYDALLAGLGEALEKVGVLDAMGAVGQTIPGDAEAMRGIVETARSKHKADPEKFGFGMRLAAALLALEAKQYDAANEFFDLAMEAIPMPRKPQGEAPAEPKADAAEASPPQAAEVLLAWGVGLLMGDRAAEAAKVFQRGIDEKALPEDNPAFYFYLAGALALCERTDEALAAARKAAEKKKDSARYRGRVAWVLYFAKRYGEAKQAYTELVKEFDADHASTETRDVMREARLVLSNLCVVENRLPEAEEWLEQVLDEYPDDVGAMNDLGYLWADANKHLARAERMIRRAVEAEPDNMAYRDSLGWVLFRLGRHQQAVAELEKAAAGKKVDGVVLDHLGDAYQKTGQHDKALDAWRRAAEAFRQEKEPEKAKGVEKKIAN